MFAYKNDRHEYFWQVAAILGCAVLLLMPIGTFLWTSPILLRDVYTLFAWGIGIALLVSFASSYVSTVRTRGYSWLWVLGGIVMPFLLFWGLTEYSTYRWHQDNSYPTGDLNQVAAYLVLPLLFGLPLVLPKRTVAEKENVSKAGKMSPRSLSLGCALATILLVSSSAIYAGLFQNGVWLGRYQYDWVNRNFEPSINGYIMLTCGNFSGIRATSLSHPDGGGFHRDAYTDVEFDLVLMNDDTFDIRTRSSEGSFSYQDDGFSISARGLEIDENDNSSIYDAIAESDRFIAMGYADSVSNSAASGSPASPGAITTVTMVFQRRPESSYGSSWDVTLTTASSRPGLASLEVPAHSSSNLMVGDCE